MNTTLKLAVFASGSGSNFQAILDAIDKGKLNAEVKLCVSNKPNIGALERAQNHGIATIVLNAKQFATESRYTQVLLEALQQHEVNFIALAGYLQKIPIEIVQAFENRMLNIHPSLLPAFGGKGMYGERVHRAVLQSGTQWTGATVHLVDAEYDTGKIILQKPVPVRPDDTPETLAARVLKMEHRLYPEALQIISEQLSVNNYQ